MLKNYYGKDWVQIIMSTHIRIMNRLIITSRYKWWRSQYHNGRCNSSRGECYRGGESRPTLCYECMLVILIIDKSPKSYLYHNYDFIVWVWRNISCPQSCYHLRGFWSCPEDVLPVDHLWGLSLCCACHRPLHSAILGHAQWPNHLHSVMVSLTHHKIHLGLPSGDVSTRIWALKEHNGRHKWTCGDTD